MEARCEEGAQTLDESSCERGAGHRLGSMPGNVTGKARAGGLGRARGLRA